MPIIEKHGPMRVPIFVLVLMYDFDFTHSYENS